MNLKNVVLTVFSIVLIASVIFCGGCQSATNNAAKPDKDSAAKCDLEKQELQKIVDQQRVELDTLRQADEAITQMLAETVSEMDGLKQKNNELENQVQALLAQFTPAQVSELEKGVAELKEMQKQASEKAKSQQ